MATPETEDKILLQACPVCGSTDVLYPLEWDCGIERETGYHDCGQEYRCLACGARGETEELAIKEVPCV